MGRLPVVEMIVLDANILIRAVLGTASAALKPTLVMEFGFMRPRLRMQRQRNICRLCYGRRGSRTPIFLRRSHICNPSFNRSFRIHMASLRKKPGSAYAVGMRQNGWPASFLRTRFAGIPTERKETIH